MELQKIGRAGSGILVGFGVALVLIGLVPLGDADANIAFWLSAIGFDRLPSLVPATADLWVTVTGLAAISSASLLILLQSLSRRNLRGREATGPRLSRIEQKLINSEWVLIYEPQQNLSKPLLFNADGTIGEGRDQNENTWAVSGRYLDIFRESGLLHNRFEFHDSGEKLNFVREPRAMGTKGQHILLAP